MTLEQMVGQFLRDALRDVVREEFARLKAQPDEELLTLRQAAAASNLSVSTLKALRADGHLVAIGSGKLARYTVAAVRKALEGRAQDGDATRHRALEALRRHRGA